MRHLTPTTALIAMGCSISLCTSQPTQGSADGVGRDTAVLQDSRTLPDLFSLSPLFEIGWVRKQRMRQRLCMLARSLKKTPWGFHQFQSLFSSALCIGEIPRRRSETIPAVHSKTCAALASHVHCVSGQFRSWSSLKLCYKDGWHRKMGLMASERIKRPSTASSWFL